MPGHQKREALIVQQTWIGHPAGVRGKDPRRKAGDGFVHGAGENQLSQASGTESS
jgi:hypothetical protein